MTCFDLQQIISIKYIYSKSFVNSSRKHKETSGFEVFNFTFQWFFCSFPDSRQDLSLRSPTRFKSVLHSPQQEINVFRSSKHNSPRPLLVLLIFFVYQTKHYIAYNLCYLDQSITTTVISFSVFFTVPVTFDVSFYLNHFPMSVELS